MVTSIIVAVAAWYFFGVDIYTSLLIAGALSFLGFFKPQVIYIPRRTDREHF